MRLRVGQDLFEWYWNQFFGAEVESPEEFAEWIVLFAIDFYEDGGFQLWYDDEGLVNNAGIYLTLNIDGSVEHPAEMP